MNSRRWYLSAVVAVFSLLGAAVVSSSSIESVLRDEYGLVSGSGDTRTYNCQGTPAEAADALAQQARPSERAQDNGIEYLRYSRHIVIISPVQPSGCTIRLESTNGAYSSGAYIFLGGGFNPSSPAAGSSGGSGGGSGGSGGYGGVK